MLDKKEMRQVYSQSLIDLAKKNKKIVVLDADLMSSHATKAFKDEYPRRYRNIGIAEANMVSIAAGLSACGKIPFCNTFAPFIARRTADQIAVSICYAKQNVKLVASDPGIAATMNGGTHMSVGDVGIMSSIPEMVVFEPVDANMLQAAMPHVVKHYGPMYIRLFRKQAHTIFPENMKFNLFKGNELFRGKDVCIVASGIMVKKALEAREVLKEKGLDVGIVCIHTLKPIDENILIKVAKYSKAVVTAENHNILNGLGATVASVLARNYPVPMRMVAIQDRFGEVGDQKYLEKELGLETQNIIDAVNDVLTVKRR